MQILLIEDNSNKLKQIKRVLTEIYPESNIEEAYSFNSGVRKVYENKWNLIILDMSLPTYDITHTESGGDKKPVAGKKYYEENAQSENYCSGSHYYAV